MADLGCKFSGLLGIRDERYTQIILQKKDNWLKLKFKEQGQNMQISGQSRT